MLARMNSAAPSIQRVPVRKSSPMVAPDPMYANRASSCFLGDDRSAMAPVTGSTTTGRRTESETAYGKIEPGSTFSPPAWITGLRHWYVGSSLGAGGQFAAVSAMWVRYGPRKTEMTVVE